MTIMRKNGRKNGHFLKWHVKLCDDRLRKHTLLTKHIPLQQFHQGPRHQKALKKITILSPQIMNKNKNNKSLYLSANVFSAEH